MLVKHTESTVSEMCRGDVEPYTLTHTLRVTSIDKINGSTKRNAVFTLTISRCTLLIIHNI